MRSRCDDIDPQLAVDRALSLGLCGFGTHGHGSQMMRRVERFAEAADGSFAWTRDVDGMYWLGQISGPYFYDDGGASVDLVHVRPCRWKDSPVTESSCPAAVVAAFGKGGRNFQQIHDEGVGEQSVRLWERI